MSGRAAHPGSRLHGLRVAVLLAFVSAVLTLVPTPGFAISRTEVVARAQSWVDVPVRYSQTRYYRGYRTDCSGFTSMAWKMTLGGHPYSYTTRSLHDVASVVASTALLPGDALVRYNHHAIVFFGWLDASHTYYVAYEQTSPNTIISIRSIADSLAVGYVPYRRRGITAGPPAWNAVANPSFDTWWRGVPVWWNTEGGYGASVTSQTAVIAKTGKWSLRLTNPSGRARDVTGVSQTAAVATGTPYALSLWASTAADPAGLTMRLEFFAANGASLGATTTTGARCGVGPDAFGMMSLLVTSPATATSATVTVRIAGGVDASGTPGTSALIDEVRLYDRSPVQVTLEASGLTMRRGQTVALEGTVTAPVPYGVVRVYVTRPGAKGPSVLGDRRLVAGAWSMPYKPGSRGTYRFTATYLGYGPYGAVGSVRRSVTVK